MAERASVEQALASPRIAIEAVTPAVEEGRFAAKALIGRPVALSAVLICDGHRKLGAEVRGRHPEVIFLSEAFSRPAMMARLGKVGFSQSYTYFTWRNTKAELQEYFTELNQPPWRDCYRPNFFVNTPDINPRFLHHSGRAGFLIRAALATMGSGLWGMYSGFELCESQPLAGKEEYLDSEKYQLRPRNWQGHAGCAPGNRNGPFPDPAAVSRHSASARRSATHCRRWRAVHPDDSAGVRCQPW